MGTFSFMDMIAVVAPAVSVLAFLVAVHAVFQAALNRRGDIMIEVTRGREPLEDMLRPLKEQSAHLRPDLFMNFPLRLRKSDEERKLDQYVQRIGAKYAALRDELARVPGTDTIRTHFRAERSFTRFNSRLLQV